MRVFLTDEALGDLERISDTIAADNPPRALSFVRELVDKARGLAEHPEAFPLVPRYARLGIRRRLHRNYLIFYRVEADRITVIHILHGARDYEALLFDEE